MAMLEVKELSKHYARRGARVRAVDGVSFTLEAGDFVVVHGPSGSGKSTLLLLLGGMLTPTGGTVSYDHTSLYGHSRQRLNRFRKRTVGFLFQKFHLMPYLTVFDNIRMPLALRGDDRQGADRIAAIADRLKIADRLQHRPDELSVGEQQRVAMARTLAGDPQLILADEPTGNLDRANGDIIGECLEEENGKGRIVVLATHDASLMGLGRRKLAMESGRVLSDITT